MPFSVALMRKMDTTAPEVKEVLWLLLEEIEQQREAAVTKTDFNDLKQIVRELAQAQQRTEQKVTELAQAQQRTEQKIAELAEAQREAARELASLSRAHDNTRSQLGGLSRSMSYALENEAYRKLPAFLKTHHQLDVTERLVRTWIGDEEINFYAHARRGAESAIIVGESVMRLDDASKLGQLERKLAAARAEQSLPLIPLLVTHIATPDLLAQARQAGIVVVQSFEWD